MEDKKWYQSKAIWAGIVGVVIVAYNTLSTSLGWPAIPEFVYAILGAFGIYSRTVANTTIK